MPTDSFASPVVVIRPALPMDKADVFEFTKFTWDGEDYIKYVWDYWFAEQHGGLFVAEYAGHAIGMGKLTQLSPGNWWMQGLRVDPQHQDKHIGSRLNDYFVQHWLEHGEGAVRFLTGEEKVKVHRMAERNGFVRVAERGKFNLSALDEPLEGESFTRITESDIPAAVELARRSELTGLCLGLVDLGWKYAEISPKPFFEILHDDECFAYWWQDRRGLVLGWEDESHAGEKEYYLALSLLACERANVADLFSDLRKLGAQKGRSSIKWYAFLTHQLQALLTELGFEQAHQHVNYLFEKRHPTRP